MSFVLQPWQLLIIIVSAWMTKFQQELIDYVLTENQVLKEKLGCKRILLNDDQRRRLAVKRTILGRQRLLEIGTLFTLVQYCVVFLPVLHLTTSLGRSSPEAR